MTITSHDSYIKCDGDVSSNRILAGLALAVSMAFSSSVAAERLIANAGFASDYVFRGESRTEDGLNPVAFGGIDYVADTGAYAGLWLGNSAQLNEADVYLGIALREDEFIIDLGAVGYFFPQSAANDDEQDHSELYVGLHYGWFQGYFWQRVDEEQSYVDANLIYPIYTSLKVELHLGHRFGDADENVDDLTDARVGVDFKGWKLSLSHTDKEDENPRVYVSKRFDFTIF